MGHRSKCERENNQRDTCEKIIKKKTTNKSDCVKIREHKEVKMHTTK